MMDVHYFVWDKMGWSAVIRVTVRSIPTVPCFLVDDDNKPGILAHAYISYTSQVDKFVM